MSRFLDLKEFGEAARYLRLTNLEHLAAKAQAFDGTHCSNVSHAQQHNQSINNKNLYLLAGTKRVWMPDDVEAYIEVEVRELNGDKTTVETKDGRVRHQLSFKIQMCLVLIFFQWFNSIQMFGTTGRMWLASKDSKLFDKMSFVT